MPPAPCTDPPGPRLTNTGTTQTSRLLDGLGRYLNSQGVVEALEAVGGAGVVGDGGADIAHHIGRSGRRLRDQLTNARIAA
jgi:hypothetical protein